MYMHLFLINLSDHLMPILHLDFSLLAAPTSDLELTMLPPEERDFETRRIPT